MAKNPAEKAASKISKAYDPVIEKFAKAIKENLASGMTPSKAVDAAAQSSNMSAFLKFKMTKEIESMVEGLGGKIKDDVAFRRWYLNKVWIGEEMNLSSRINDMAKFEDVKASISTSLKDGKAWNSIAQSLTDKDLTKADIPKYMNDLLTASRKVTKDPATVREYRKFLKAAESNISNLAKNGAPTQRLKAAYANIVEASKKTSSKSIEHAIDRMAKAKARYNADRIARTETARAYAQQTYSETIEDDQVIGIGYDLNSGHPRTDICDFYTGADLYGLGAGRYPLSHLPKYPFHPNCLCSMYNVYSGNVGKFDSKKAAKFLKNMPESKRKFLLGSEGNTAFKRNPSTWEDNLSGFDGYKSITTLFEADKIKN